MPESRFDNSGRVANSLNLSTSLRATPIHLGRSRQNNWRRVLKCRSDRRFQECRGRLACGIGGHRDGHHGTNHTTDLLMTGAEVLLLHHGHLFGGDRLANLI